MHLVHNVVFIFFRTMPNDSQTIQLCSFFYKTIKTSSRLSSRLLNNYCTCSHLFGGQKGVFPDLLATSGDYLRVWRAGEPETRLECVLNNVSFSLACL
jgi:hypothetical protein